MAERKIIIMNDHSLVKLQVLQFLPSLKLNYEF